MPDYGYDRNDGLTINDLFTVLRRNRGRFVLTFLLVTLLVLAGFALLRPKFTSSGALFLEKPSAGAGGGEAGLGDLMPMLGFDSNIESNKEIFNSYDLAARVVEQLGLSAEMDGPREYLLGKPRFWEWKWKRDVEAFDRGLGVRDVVWHRRALMEREYQVRFDAADRFSVIALPANTEVGKGTLGQPVNVGDLSFTLAGAPPAPVPAGTVFDLEIKPTQLVLEDFAEALSVDGGGRIPGKSNDVIRVRFTDKSPYVARAVVERLSREFIDLKQAWATSVTRTVLEFVDKQLATLREDLNRSTAQLAKFQQESGLVALEPQLQAEITQLVEAEVKLREAEVKAIELEALSKNLTSQSPQSYIFSFMDEPVLQKMGEALVDLNQEIATLESQFNRSYPPLQELIAAREKTIAELKSTAARYLERAKNDQKELTRIVGDYRGKFTHLPESGRVLAEHLRSSKLYEDMYLFLLQEQQKTRIAEASTLSNIRVVDQPYLPLEESSPSLPVALALALAAGAVASVSSVFFREVRNSRFTSVEELKAALPNPVFAVVPSRAKRAKRNAPETIDANAQSGFMEAIRQLRANLVHSMAGKRHQMVMVTSSMPADGKTTIAANLAVTLIRSERVTRVLLVDADMQKPSLHSIFGKPASPGLSDYLNGQATLDDIVQTIEFDGFQIDLVCAGPTPPSPVELAETQAMTDFLAFAAENYMFTVVDSPPYPAATTALIIAARFDRVLSVCRLGKTDRSLFRRHVDDLTAVNKHVGLVINIAEKSGAYGDAYGYGYGNGEAQKAARAKAGAGAVK